ncbi:Holliday junction resolvase RuvX [Salisediminibacterium halotolerans]|uniref:Holliday junction resolvase RuvX n=1 Tax=Salisediminibacterium halotolerans TaxID=517425 RepID=UPI000EAF8D16|nr:Holliday junction resolvase RuvX [Salisediminibacterium halotolerans]RLJ78360.1 putative Holliday junction resolvase [Actinophytocola xinjiangensis]RPE88298.1 putative Holliday junction resolvase [Salisediminibacterium halotolerans]TWG37336.1 putative Holliday junction resolvase [Salisediminibacterium halotolerans]GEL06801.1 putative pre-16S rRNA nuclease [Salisediminibacterium halotolerans]
MKTMGLDVGTKTIGVAVSDAFGWTAQGIETIRRKTHNEKADFQRLETLINENDVTQLVVGLPKNMDGTIGGSGEMCELFAEKLRERTKLPVEMWDERLTTVAAERMLVDADVSRQKRKKVIDKMAAVMILQGYLDNKGGNHL